MASCLLILLVGFLPLALCSNYDSYINHLHKRNQALHNRAMDDPVMRDSLTQLYNRYPGRDEPFPETEDEDGEIPEGLWNDLLSQLSQARSGERPIMQNNLWGEHRVSGGSGEGQQWLESDSGPVSTRPEVKTDRLPAYCNPPNPCPTGMNPEDAPGPCDANVEDSKEFNKNWIWSKMMSGECTCDDEHMKPCPRSSRNQQQRASMYTSANANPYLSGNKRAQVVGKKAPTMWEDTKKNVHSNPYLDGEVLRSVNKKAGPPEMEIM